MPKPRAPKGTWETRAADVLAGRAAVDAGELIDLVHEVNPTGRGRSPEETAARYAVKSRLQSLLVTRFADDIEVKLDADDPGVAAIRHRYRRHDACHAVIATLDDDARSWVQRELDLAGSGPEVRDGKVIPPAAGSGSGRRGRPAAVVDASVSDDDRSAEALLAEGEQAREAYDYERAQRCLSLAVTRSGGSVESAVAFLSFAVDALAADADALAAEHELPAATLAHPGVAVLLAVAAARSGDEERAVGHLGHVREPRAAEALVLLARSAIDAQDADRAAHHLHAAEERDPAHPDLRALAEALAHLRAEARAPREAALAALVAAGDDAAALAEGQAILARWPESEAARRAVRRLEERQREAAGSRLLAEAEEALAAGRPAVALDLLQRALAGPLPAAAREGARERLRAVDAAERERLGQQQAAEIAALIVEGQRALVGSVDERARGLTAYAELDEEARARVRARTSLPVLGWLDQIPAARPGGRARAAAEAVLALQRAAALVDGDPAAAGALVAPHSRLLEAVPVFEAVTQRARDAAAKERARRARAALAEAEEALAGNHFARAQELFDRVDVRALPAEERARAEALPPRIAAVEARYRAERRLERLQACGAFGPALALAGELLASDSDPADQARHRAAIEAATAARARFAVKVDDLAGGPELLQNLDFAHWGRTVSAWVQDGGHQLFLGTVLNAWMFLRVVDIPTGKVTRAARFALEIPTFECSVLAHAGGVSLTGNTGLFEFTVPDLVLVQSFARPWSHEEGRPDFSYVVRLPGTRMLWGREGDGDVNDRLVAVDLEGELGGKILPAVNGPFVLSGASPRMAYVKARYDEGLDDYRHSLAVCEPGGAAVGRALVPVEPDSAVVHPSGAGLVVCGKEFKDGGYALSLVEISDHLDAGPPRPMAAHTPVYPSPELVSVPAAGLLFFRYKLWDGDDFLVALRAPAAGGTAAGSVATGGRAPLEEIYRVQIPPRTTLVHDTSARRAFALVDHAGGVAITELGAEPPTFALPDPASARAAVDQLVEPFRHLIWCGDDFSKTIDEYRSLRRRAPALRPAAVAAMEEAAATDVAASMKLFRALLHGRWYEPAEALLARLHARFPDEPTVRAGRAALLSRRRAWRELLAELDATGPGPYPGRAAQHYHHLRAVSAAALGDVLEADRQVALATAVEPENGTCFLQIKPLRDGLTALARPISPADLAVDTPAPRQIVAVIAAADARLREGDPAGAISLLERPVVWDLGECQSLARLAEAYLALPTPSAEARFRKSLALASFLSGVYVRTYGDRSEALAPGLGYDEERLAALERAALAWMADDLGVPRGAPWELERAGWSTGVVE